MRQSANFAMGTLVATLLVALLSSACSGGLDGESGHEVTKAGGFTLVFENLYVTESTGGAPPYEEIPIVWSGQRSAGNKTGDSFTVSTSVHAFPNQQYTSQSFAGNLNPGDWTISVEVNGTPRPCGTPVGLPPGKNVTVRATVGANAIFTGCVSS